MPIAGLEELVTPAAFALSQVCQAAIAIVMSIPDWGWPDLDAMGTLLAQVPSPRTYPDALLSATLLYQFFEGAALEIHRRVHGGTIPADCPFDATRSARLGRVEQIHAESWSAAATFRAWSATFTDGLALHHRASLAHRAIDRLRARMGVDVNASDLARDVGCSVPVLHRQVREATGKSVRQYAIQLRIEHAIDLLRNTDWKMEAIACEVGWKSKKNLYCAFARELGTTPASIRRTAACGHAGARDDAA